MDENVPSDTTALATLGRLDVADVPDMGYEPWREAVRDVELAQGERNGGRGITLIMTPVGGFMFWMMFTGGMSAATPLAVIIFMCVLIGILTGAGPAYWAYNSRQLAKMPDPAGLLPPGSSPELAEREHALVTGIEAHNRNIRRMRRMATTDSETLERAYNEEHALRGGTLALAEARTEIAGLLTD